MAGQVWDIDATFPTQLPLRDFSDIPLDCTALIRRELPLIQVDIDTGPRTRADLRDKLDYAEHISVTSINWKLATEVAALLTWALDGYVPAFTPSGQLI